MMEIEMPPQLAASFIRPRHKSSPVVLKQSSASLRPRPHRFEGYLPVMESGVTSFHPGRAQLAYRAGQEAVISSIPGGASTTTRERKL
jgi:hypothetical protein